MSCPTRDDKTGETIQTKPQFQDMDIFDKISHIQEFYGSKQLKEKDNE